MARSLPPRWSCGEFEPAFCSPRARFFGLRPEVLLELVCEPGLRGRFGFAVSPGWTGDGNSAGSARPAGPSRAARLVEGENGNMCWLGVEGE